MIPVNPTIIGIIPSKLKMKISTNVKKQYILYVNAFSCQFFISRARRDKSIISPI